MVVVYLRGPAAATIACASAGSFPSVMFTVPATVVPTVASHCSCWAKVLLNSQLSVKLMLQFACSPVLSGQVSFPGGPLVFALQNFGSQPWGGFSPQKCCHGPSITFFESVKPPDPLS